MQWLIFFTAVGLLVAIFFAKKETLSKKAKIAIVLVVGHTLLFAWLYEFDTTRTSENNRAVLNAFKQGKIVYCDTLEITSEDFIFVNGTLSFIPSNKNINQKGVVIDIATCKTTK